MIIHSSHEVPKYVIRTSTAVDEIFMSIEPPKKARVESKSAMSGTVIQNGNFTNESRMKIDSTATD